MTEPKRISIVIPCHNEEGAIPAVMEKIHRARQQFPQIHEVIVVDDGSTDSSALLLAQQTNIKVVSNKKALGYGGALKVGFQKASGDYILFLDMDDTYDIADLPAMYDLLVQKDLDVVFGNRLTEMNGMPWVRRIGNTLYYVCLRFLGFPRIGDPCTGMRLFKSHLKENFCQVTPNDLSYSMALTMKILKSQYAYGEMKIDYNERIGESKLNPLIDGGRFFWAILINRLSA